MSRVEPTENGQHCGATVVGARIFGIAGDGVRNYGASVLLSGSKARYPGQVKTPETTRYGFNAVGGTMKVSAGSNVGTTAGNVTVS